MHVLKNPEYRSLFDEMVRKADPSGSLTEFIEWLDRKKLLCNCDTDQLEMELGWEDLGLPCIFIPSQKLEIMICKWSDDRVLVGVDPKGSFDKIQRCAIRAFFPMVKDKVKDFTDHLEELLTDKEKFKEFEEFAANLDQYDPYE